MIEELLPYDFEINYDYIKINNSYSSYLVVKNYFSDIQILESFEKLLFNKDVSVNICVKKANSSDYTKLLTNVVSKNSSEKKANKFAQRDIDVVNKIEEQAKILRNLIQVENEDVYQVAVYFCITSNTKGELLNKVRNYCNEAYSKGFSIVPLNFRQLQGYLASLPFRQIDNKFFENTHKIFTTSSLSSLFPFYSDGILELNGICIGESNNKPCIIDFIKRTNNNRNMVIFGSSGAGKSYFVKLMILQYLYKGNPQVIIDLEGEYARLAMELGQTVITMKQFNILEIEESAVNNNMFLKNKINNICKDLCLEDIAEISLEEVELIKEWIKKIYNEFNITENADSLYSLTNNDSIYTRKKYIESSKFPKANDLIAKIGMLKINKKNKEKLLIRLKRINGDSTRIEAENRIIVYNVSHVNPEDKDYFLEIIMRKLEEHVQEGLVIYIDEVWQLTNYGKKQSMLEILTEMYKTLRKRGAGIVVSTQDIVDILSYDNGNFGKSILNNSLTKVYFKLEYMDLDNMKKTLGLSGFDLEKIKKLKRGNAFINYGGIKFNVDIIASDYENFLIEGENNEESFNSFRK
ncbi:MAG: DUF87 domain-containing protein [Clostridia bacterium]|nr:DUF87 domain-containing protein [Clostridia bacterium]